MKNDARQILNKKKFKKAAINQISKVQRGSMKVAKGAMDARRILNLKRSKKFSPQKQVFQNSRSYTTTVPVFKRTTSSSTNAATQKQVALSRDGNIVVTAKSSGMNVQHSSGLTFNRSIPSSSRLIQKPAHQWVPADVDMDNIEHIGIGDVINMETLPPAVLQPSVHQNRYILPSDVLSMQHTMVADEVASPPADQSVRVLVTQLCPSVSKQDITELFSDVGLVKAAEMPQPGTAIVEFYYAQDASRACSIYHDRLLDGRAMKCYLQAKAVPQRTSISQRLGDRIQSTGFTPTLPSNPRSRYNPRDVRFTVKLA